MKNHACAIEGSFKDPRLCNGDELWTGLHPSGLVCGKDGSLYKAEKEKQNMSLLEEAEEAIAGKVTRR